MASQQDQQTREYGKQRFERFLLCFDQSYRLLGYYAALPFVLTPELLHYLRTQFLRTLPWEAEVDLLLSEVCRPVGYEQYAMDTAVRAYLLDEMAEVIGREQMEAVARLLICYIQQLEQTNTFLDRRELQAQQWGAMVYITGQRETAVRQIAQAFQASLESTPEQSVQSLASRAELLGFSNLIQELSPQIAEYEGLLAYADVVRRVWLEPMSLKAEEVMRTYDVLEGVELQVPDELIPEALITVSEPGDSGEAWLPPLSEFAVRETTVVTEQKLEARKYQTSIALIYHAESSGAEPIFLGSGFLVGQRRIVTCAHIFSSSTGSADFRRLLGKALLKVEFPFARSRDSKESSIRYTARMLYYPGEPWGGIATLDDVVVLQITQEMLEPLEPWPLHLVAEADGHRCQMTGVEELRPKLQSLEVLGTCVGKRTNGVLQVELEAEQASDTISDRFEAGFSGIPVWDATSQGIIGMFVATYTNPPSGLGALVIPSQTLNAVLARLEGPTIEFTEDGVEDDLTDEEIAKKKDDLPLVSVPIEMATIEVKSGPIHDFSDAVQRLDGLLKEDSKRLTDGQRQILQGAWQGRSYQKIATEIGYATNLAVQQGNHLWQILSTLLGLKVTKTTVRRVLMNSSLLAEQTSVRIQRQSGTVQQFTEALGNGIELEMVSISGGPFQMGSPEDELDNYEDEQPKHKVTVPDFYMGKYPVTQAQWRFVASQVAQVERELEPEPSHFGGENADRLPVESVSWEDAQEFCRRLSVHTGRVYRLPSEAEWEYGCRAGTTTPFYFGETITTDVANYRGTDDEDMGWSGSYGRGPKGVYRGKTTPVDEFANAANTFGLCDMHGNVWEWCEDHWHDDYEDAPTDGSAWLRNKDDDGDSSSRVRRGGSWDFIPRPCRSACRGGIYPRFRDYYLGFRVILAPP